MPGDLLAIAIPTYNRPEILQENLRMMLPEIARLGVPVYISDDSPGPETEAMIIALRQDYERIYYKRNTPGLGHDRNCVATLQLPDADYVWYLGDAIAIDAGALDKVHAALSTLRPDFLFVNSEGRCDDKVDRVVANVGSFLQHNAWHLTLTGATVYSRNAVLFARTADIGRWRNFPQLGLIFKCGLGKNRTAYWVGSCGVHANRSKKSYWTNAVITTFAVDWVNLVRDFAAFYSRAQLENIFVSHSRHTDTFALRNIVIYRLNGGIPLQLVWRHRSALGLASHIGYLPVLLVSLLPVAVCRWVLHALRQVRKACT